MKIHIDELLNCLGQDPVYGVGEHLLQFSNEIVEGVLLDNLQNPLYKTFHKKWKILSCSDDVVRQMVFLWCGMMELPTYHKGGQLTGWKGEGFLDNSDRWFSIELDELRKFLTQHAWSKPTALFSDSDAFDHTERKWGLWKSGCDIGGDVAHKVDEMNERIKELKSKSAPTVAEDALRERQIQKLEDKKQELILQAESRPCLLDKTDAEEGEEEAVGVDCSNLLFVALDGWFDKPLCDLPEELRQRVEEDFPPVRWGELAPSQRESRACYMDAQNDPAWDEERTHGFDIACQEDDIKRKLDEVDRTCHEGDPLKLEAQERMSDKLSDELVELLKKSAAMENGSYQKEHKKIEGGSKDGSGSPKTTADALTRKGLRNIQLRQFFGLLELWPDIGRYSAFELLDELRDDELLDEGLKITANQKGCVGEDSSIHRGDITVALSRVKRSYEQKQQEDFNADKAWKARGKRPLEVKINEGTSSEYGQLIGELWVNEDDVRQACAKLGMKHYYWSTLPWPFCASGMEVRPTREEHNTSTEGDQEASPVPVVRLSAMKERESIAPPDFEENEGETLVQAPAMDECKQDGSATDDGNTDGGNNRDKSETKKHSRRRGVDALSIAMVNANDHMLGKNTKTKKFKRIDVLKAMQMLRDLATKKSELLLTDEDKIALTVVNIAWKEGASPDWSKRKYADFLKITIKKGDEAADFTPSQFEGKFTHHITHPTKTGSELLSLI